MNDYDRGWISALIDSEGSLYWKKTKKPNRDYIYPTIQITNTNWYMLLKAQSLLGGSICATGNHNITCFQLVITPGDWGKWLKDVPLIEKENKRQEFLRWDITHE